MMYEHDFHGPDLEELMEFLFVTGQLDPEESDEDEESED